MKIYKTALQSLAVIAYLLFSVTLHAQTKENTRAGKKIQALPRDLEIQLALSALPPHLRDSATVYVLNPDKGFEKARQGTNGFYAFVARTGEDAMRGSWPLNEYRDDILYPISFDQTGVKAQMQLFFDIAAMQAEGMPPQELKKLIQERYKTHYYKPPEKAGLSYMLSPILRTYTNPENNDSVYTANNPHIMFYAPNLSNHDIGGAQPKFRSPYPFVIFEGPHGYSIEAVGAEERAVIYKEYKEMLDKLCQINEKWCLPKKEIQMDHSQHSMPGY